MKRILTTILIVLCCSPLIAQGLSQIELSAGGGYSSLGYKMQSVNQIDAATSGSYHLMFQASYAYFFNPYIGISIGGAVERYGGKARLEGEHWWLGVTDSEGEQYNHLTYLTNLQEKQQVWYAEPVLSLQWRAPINNNFAITGAVGVSYGIAISKRNRYSGTTTHTGIYPQWGLTLHDLPDYGFYGDNEFSGDAPLKLNQKIAAIVRVGAEYSLTQHTSLFFGAYFTYAFNKAIQTGETTRLGFRNDRADMSEIHGFMTDYISAFQTEHLKSLNRPFAAGLEIGVRWRFEHHKLDKCLCEDN